MSIWIQLISILLLVSFSATFAFVRIIGVKHRSFTYSKCYATSLLDYLASAQLLGPVRFVVVGTGAILETVGSFDNMRVSESPKGKLATFSTDDPCFECHIRLNEVKQIRQVEIEKFGRQLRVARFLDGAETTVLSAILHKADDDTARIEAWYVDLVDCI